MYAAAAGSGTLRSNDPLSPKNVAADLSDDNGDAATTHTWEWWYRFALDVLGLAETEAREYADRRSLEDANRERIAALRAA